MLEPVSGTFAAWLDAERSGKKMVASNARMRVPEEGWTLRKQDGGSKMKPGGSGRKMAVREER
jgi:hypothetical protein